MEVWYIEWDAERAGYEEAQSRLRLSCACRANVRPLSYPLDLRILEMAQKNLV